MTLRSFLEDLQRYVVHGSFFLLPFKKSDREACLQFRGQRKIEWMSFNIQMKHLFVNCHATVQGEGNSLCLVQSRSPLGESLYPILDERTHFREREPLPRLRERKYLNYTGYRLEHAMFKSGIFYFFIPLFLAHYVAYRNHIELLDEMIHVFRSRIELHNAPEKEEGGAGGSHDYQTPAQKACINLTTCSNDSEDIYPDGYDRWPSVGAIDLNRLLVLVKRDLSARQENSKNIDVKLQEAIAVFQDSDMLASKDLKEELEPTVAPFRQKRMVAYERHRKRLARSMASTSLRKQGHEVHSSGYISEHRKRDLSDYTNDADEPQRKRPRNSDNQGVPAEPQTLRFFSSALNKAENTQRVLIHGYTTVKRWLAVVTNDDIFKHIVNGKSAVGKVLNAIAHEREGNVEKIYESATRLSSLFTSDAEGSDGTPLSEAEKAKYTDAFREVVAGVYEVSGDLLGPDLPPPPLNGQLKVAAFISRARARAEPEEEESKSIVECAEFVHLS